MEKKDNPAILKKYILVPDYKRAHEYIIALIPVEHKTTFAYEIPKQALQVFAVYKPTGRGPFKNEDGNKSYEYEYMGVRVI